MGCTGSKAMLKNERVKTYNKEDKLKEKDKEEQKSIDQEPRQQEAQVQLFENKETEKAGTPQKRKQESQNDGEKPPAFKTKLNEEVIHKDGLVPVKKDINFNVIEPRSNENAPNLSQTPLKSNNKPVHNEKSVKNEIKIDNVLKPNYNISNNASINKMSNSVTQDKLINMVKSEVYDNILNTALDEVKKNN